MCQHICFGGLSSMPTGCTEKFDLKNQTLCNLSNIMQDIMKNTDNFIEQATKTAADVLLQFDRLENNPDRNSLIDRLRTQLQNDGYVTLVIFGCLDWIKSKLFTKTPEDFISDVVRDFDLFMPRVPKINEIVKNLQMNGITSKVTIVLGDTDVGEYFEQILNTAGISLDAQLLDTRISKYKKTFADRAAKVIKGNTEIINWSEIENLFNDIEPTIPNPIFQEALNSMVSAYTGESYKGLGLKDTDEIFLKATKKRIDMYSRQGVMVDKMLNGIVLQTETPWILSSSMLKLNSPDLPIIYPWIRSEELDTI